MVTLPPVFSMDAVGLAAFTFSSAADWFTVKTFGASTPVAVTLNAFVRCKRPVWTSPVKLTA